MDTRADILTVAAILFSERGYRGTTMREIAQCLDIREGSLYAHIKSKEELLWEIISRVARLFLSHAYAVSPVLPVEAQLIALISAHLEIIARERHSAIVFFREWISLPPPLRREIQTQRDSYEACFYRVITAGVQQHLFQMPDCRLACLFVLSALNWTHQWLNPVGPLPIAYLAECYSTLILHALKGG